MTEIMTIILMYSIFSYLAMIGWISSVSHKFEEKGYELTGYGSLFLLGIFLCSPFTFPIFLLEGTPRLRKNVIKQVWKKVKA